MDRVTSLAIGNCRVLLNQRVVLVGDEIADFGSRALALLLCLAERPGLTISNDELIKAVWPRSIVEESSLRAQIAKLRKKLAHYHVDARVMNHCGQGYSLVVSPSSEQDEPKPSPHPEKNGAVCSPSLFGREVDIANVNDALAFHPIVTLTGPCGVGKSALALEVVRQWNAGVGTARYIDLDKHHSLEVTKNILGRAIRELGMPSASRRSCSGDQPRPLLILDHIDHQAETLQGLSEVFSRSASRVNILACATHPLHVEGERVVRLAPLGFPLTGSGALSYGRSASERLFISMAESRGLSLLRTEAVARLIAGICSRAEGSPLAIQLAVTQLEHLPIESLASELNSGFDVLTSNDRTRPERHRSLHSCFEFQYNRLTDKEKILLERLSVFRAVFSAQAAIAVAAADELTERDVFAALAGLSGKSVLIKSSEDETNGYHLPAMIRAYALEKVRARAGFGTAFRRHAMYVLKQASVTDRDSTYSPALETLKIPDLKYALDWAFSNDGDAGIAIALALAAVPILFRNSLMDDCRRYVEQAVDKLGSGANDRRQMMELHAALGGAFMNIRGAGAQARATWEIVKDLSGQLGDLEFRLRSLWGLWVDSRNQGNYGEALFFSRRFARLSRLSGEVQIQNNALRMQGISLFHTGDLRSARMHLERLLVRPNDGDIANFQFDQRVSANTFLAQILFLEGFTEQAMAVATSNVGNALTLNHSATVCYALAQGACPVAWYMQDVAALGRFVTLLVETSSAPGLESWRNEARAYQGILNLAQGKAAGLETLRDALAASSQGRLSAGFSLAVARYAWELFERGQVDEAAFIFDDTIARADTYNENWCKAELLRLQALVTATASPPDASLILQKAYDIAERQGALAWQLRAAMSMGELQDRNDMPVTTLPAILSLLERYPEPRASPDCTRARAFVERHLQAAHGSVNLSVCNNSLRRTPRCNDAPHCSTSPPVPQDLSHEHSVRCVPDQ